MPSQATGAHPLSTRTRVADNSDAPAIRWDVLRITQFGLIVLDVSRVHQTFGFERLRPGLLLTAIAFTAAFLKIGRRADKKWLSRWTTKLMLGMAICTIGSMIFGISLGQSWGFFSQNYSKVLLTAFLLAFTVRDLRDIWLFIWAYLVGSGLLVWMAVFVFNLHKENNGVYRLSHLDTWDANDIGVLLLIALPFGLLAARTSGRLGKAASMALLLGIGVAIARSGSRGAFVGFGVVMLVYLFTLNRVSIAKRGGFVALVAVGIVVAAPKGYWKQMDTITTLKQDYNWSAAQGRRQLAVRAVKYMMAFPAFGLGIDNFGRAEGTIAGAIDEKAGHLYWVAPHNSYLESGAELGIPGLIVFCSMVVGCIVVPFRLRARIPRSWERGTWNQRFMLQAALYLPLSSIGFGVSAFFVNFAYSDPIYILAVMIGALGACVHAELRRQRRSAPQSSGINPAPSHAAAAMPVERRRHLGTPVPMHGAGFPCRFPSD